MQKASSQPPTFDLRARARDVVAYQDDVAATGRPLYLLLCGALLAGVCLGLIGLLIYRAWYQHEVSTDWAWAGVSCLFAIYVFGVYLFCYGYELYDVGKALRLTIIVAVVSVVAMIFMITVLSYVVKLKALSFGGESGMDAVEQGMPWFNTAASMLEGEQPRRGSTGPAVGASDFGLDWHHNQDAQSPPFLVHCKGCGVQFTPAPPQGACPSCGRPALAAS